MVASVAALWLAEQVEEEPEHDSDAGGHRVRAESGPVGVTADVFGGVAFPSGGFTCGWWRRPGVVPL